MKPMDDVDECVNKCMEAGVFKFAINRLTGVLEANCEVHWAYLEGSWGVRKWAVNRQPDGSICLNCEVRDWTFKTSELVLALIPPGGRLEIWAEFD